MQDAPKITNEDVDAAIVGCHYFRAAQALPGIEHSEDAEPLSLLTFCVLVLKNGFTVTGESACASPENFDAQIGRDIAYRKARDKIWPLLGYELKSRLARQAPLQFPLA